MRITSALETIRDTLKNELPGALTTAGLSDFDEYKDTDPTDTQLKSLCVYFDSRSSDANVDMLRVLIQLQLYDILDSRTATLYGDIVSETVRAYVKPGLIDMVELSSINIDLYPVQAESGTSFVFLTLDYASDVDDCYYDLDVPPPNDDTIIGLLGADSGLVGWIENT